MGTKMTIVLDVENMADFDVNFKDKIHGGTVVAMAKYDAVQHADKSGELLQRCYDGFSAYIMGRLLARKEREKLRKDILAWLET